LNRFRAADRRPLLVLGMRDITYGHEQTRREWEEDGSYELLEHVYDRILVYGSPHVFDPIREYGLPPAVAAKTVYTGYFRRAEPRRPAREVRHELGASETPLAVVSVGGGTGGAPLIEAFLEALRQGLLHGVAASIVAGPQMPAAEFARLSDLARTLPSVRLVRFRVDLESHVAAADVVVCMGGYNSVWEAIGAGKRPIVMPWQGGAGEQPLRAARLAGLGLATVVLPEDVSPERLAHAVTTELERGITPAVTLDFDGIDRTGEALARLLGR
jgi:predicted glycosyltransferase